MQKQTSLTQKDRGEGEGGVGTSPQSFPPPLPPSISTHHCYFKNPNSFPITLGSGGNYFMTYLHVAYWLCSKISKLSILVAKTYNEYIIS